MGAAAPLLLLHLQADSHALASPCTAGGATQAAGEAYDSLKQAMPRSGQQEVCMGGVRGWWCFFGGVFICVPAGRQQKVRVGGKIGREWQAVMCVVQMYKRS